MRAVIFGSCGIQVNIPIGKFPLEYKSIEFMDDKVDVDIAGVGYSHAKILGLLNDKVTFVTGLGSDMFSKSIEEAIVKTGAEIIKEIKDSESQVSVVLYDDEGRRFILREGRKDYMYKMQPSLYKSLKMDFDVALFSMAGFSRDILHVVKSAGVTIACDIQDIRNLSNEYGKEFMEYSDIIFFSNDGYDGDIEQLVTDLYKKYKYKLIGVGLGSEGCLICEDGRISKFKAFKSKVKNTVGAGDTLFATFIHFFINGDDTASAITKAQLYTSRKIQYATASKGFMSSEEFAKLLKDNSLV